MLRLNRKIGESRSSNISLRLKDSGGGASQSTFLLDHDQGIVMRRPESGSFGTSVFGLHTGLSLARPLRWLITVATILCHSISTADRIGDWRNLDIEFLFLQFRSSNAKWAHRSLPILATSLGELVGCRRLRSVSCYTKPRLPKVRFHLF